MRKTQAIWFLFFIAQLSFASTHIHLQFDSEVEAPLRAQILDDLKFMGQVQGTQATPLHQKVFGPVSGASYLQFFQNRVFNVGKSLCGDDHAVACVLSLWDNYIFITPNYTKFDHPQMARLSVIYHEARHTEKNQGNWPHASCPKPFLDQRGQNIVSIWTGAMLAGESACDATAFGSYGVQTILLKNMAEHCTNCNEKVKADSELFGSDQLNRIIDTQSRAQLEKDFAQK